MTHFMICDLNNWLTTFYKDSHLSTFTFTVDFITQKHLRIHLPKHHAIDFVINSKNAFSLIDTHLSTKYQVKYNSIPAFMELSSDHQSSYSSFLSIVPNLLSDHAMQVLPSSLHYGQNAHFSVMDALSKHLKILLSYYHASNYISTMTSKALIEKQVTEAQNMRSAYITRFMICTFYISAFGKCSIKFKSREEKVDCPISINELSVFERALNEKVYYFAFILCFTSFS